MPRTCALLASLALVLSGAVAQQVPATAVQGLVWRSIGPATTGGRIADVTAGAT